MKNKNHKSNNKKVNKNNKKETNLKEILAPKVLEVIGKKYTDIYIKHLGDKYYELIDNLINRKKFASFSNSNTKLFSEDESIIIKNVYNKKNINSTYWKDYDFVNNPLNTKKSINPKINKDNNNYMNIVEISNNNQSNEEEQTESIVIKNKDDEDDDNDNDNDNNNENKSI